MEKQIETVYVPTDEAPYFIVKDVEKEFIKARVTEQEAYLYTPEEHAAAQQALSKAEDKGEVLEPWEFGADAVFNALTKPKPTTQPTNTLDELERWIEQRSQSSDSVSHMVLLAKIQELKTITS